MTFVVGDRVRFTQDHPTYGDLGTGVVVGVHFGSWPLGGISRDSVEVQLDNPDYGRMLSLLAEVPSGRVLVRTREDFIKHLEPEGMYCIRCELNTPHCPYCTNCGGDVVPRTVSPGDKPTVVTRAVSSEVVDVGIEFSKGGTVTATLNDNRFGGHMVWIPE